MARGVLKWLLWIAAAILMVLGILFIMASYAVTIRLFVGLIFIALSLIMIYFSRERKPIEIRRTIDLSGPIKFKEIRCQNCGALLNIEKVNVIKGKTYMTCDYCENSFEITEEPKW
jgi:hypothetical protein